MNIKLSIYLGLAAALTPLAVAQKSNSAKAHSAGSQGSEVENGGIRTKTKTDAMNLILDYRQTREFVVSKMLLGSSDGKMAMQIPDLKLSTAFNCKSGEPSKLDPSKKLQHKADVAYFKGDTYTLVLIGGEPSPYNEETSRGLGNSAQPFLGLSGTKYFDTKLYHFSGGGADGGCVSGGEYVSNNFYCDSQCGKGKYMNEWGSTCSMAIDNKTGEMLPVILGRDARIMRGSDGKLLVGNPAITKHLEERERTTLKRQLELDIDIWSNPEMGREPTGEQPNAKSSLAGRKNGLAASPQSVNPDGKGEPTPEKNPLCK